MANLRSRAAKPGIWAARDKTNSEKISTLIILAKIIARFEQPWYLLSPARGSRLVRFDRIA
jgi:hypothetical protein